ncbi:acyltransferase family protein [Cellvibrio sp. QJXJ]|uniref:acyltransferase family protein n=1 Tax=Cellvibrio sp. QJXJ TaxID=2964606 RepID=UPI0021C3CA72|nr:acyltransferase family protein [Cellvibrio sp. QJXJ]UUA71191.1 acyltransferase family protein [Cellvibrio sp. QJXJ]
MTISSQHNERFDYLDAARAFALLLGIIFHASISFLPIFIGWAVMDISTSSTVSIFMMISHSFRLELFFLLAGFFSHMTFHRDDVPGFLQSRLVRIAIPFVIGWFLLRPLLVSGWIMGAESMRGKVNILNALRAGFATLGDLPKDLLVGTHLWFLYYLLLISLSIVLMHSIFHMHKSTEQKIVQFAENTMHWLCSSRLAIFAVAIPTAACLWFMNHWGMDTPDKSLVPHIPVTIIYSGFFIFGWLLQRQTNLLENFTRLSWGKFALCLLAIVAANLLARFEIKFAHPHYQLIKTGFVFSYAIMMWSLVSLTIGLFKHFLNRPSKTVRYLADSSYWLYLIHLPIVIWLQIAFAELPLHWSIKLVAICAITIALSLVLYDVLVRSTVIGMVLNGKRKPRVR